MKTPSAHAIAGCLLGTAVGDSIGLPAEGLSPRRQRRLFARIDSHRLLFGYGMVSDDTEHTCVVANALIASAGGEQAFERQLARGLRLWFLSLPVALGPATLKAVSRLCLGFGPRRSGVRSAGNGPAMRSALIGVCYGQDPRRLRNLVRISTRVTHTDPKAEHAALSVAIGAYRSASAMDSPRDYYRAVREALGGEGCEFLEILRAVVESVTDGTSTADFARRVAGPGGPSGYCLESVPIALHAWLRHPVDLRAAVGAAIRCGGDTDTMAAIAGGIVGARVGPEGIPPAWLDGLVDWPRTRNWMAAQGQLLSEVVDSGAGRRPMALPYLPLLVRNMVFAAIVVAHGLRRLLPPY